MATSSSYDPPHSIAWVIIPSSACASATWALGHHEIAVAELECAVDEHPYRERLRHLLIEARRRDDRRVDALRACNRLHSGLASVGLEPDRDLEMIEAEILREEHAATWTHRRSEAADGNGR